MARGQSGAGGYGKGVPIAFVCPVARRDGYWTMSEHSVIVRTGRTRRHRPKGAPHPRILLESHEYRCECGHVGWSAHGGILRYPVANPSRDE